MREIAVMSRRVALLAAVFIYIGFLAAFLIVWRDGLPTWPGADVHRQIGSVQIWTLAILAPWVASRCAAAERGDHFVRLAAACALSPSRVVFAKVCAMWTAVVVFALSALPLMLFAQQRAAAPIGDMVRQQTAVIALTAAVCPLAITFTLIMRRRLAGWLAATGSTLLVVAIGNMGAPDLLVPAGVWMLVGAATAMSAAIRADTSLRYLSEYTA